MRATIVSLAMLGAIAVGGWAAPASADPIDYVFTLAPENNSGVTGSGTMTLNGTMLTMNVTATGLVPDEIHPMHIHGLLGAAAPSTSVAPPSADSPPNGNGDGYVEKPEGATFSGPPLFGLPATGTPGGYSTAQSGTISFTQTYDLSNTSLYDPDNMGLALTPADIEGLTGGNATPLIDRLVEIHGLADVPASAALINGTPATPGSVVYDSQMPVAAGMIRLASASITSVPEPASLVLFATGLGAAGFLARRRRLG